MAKENEYRDLAESYAHLCREVEKAANLTAALTPKGFESLSETIRRRTGVLLSPTTLKRLWGYLDESVSPRASTLDVLARFCGWRDFGDFSAGNVPEIESGNIGSSTIRAGENISRGERVRLFWAPSRMCLIEYLGDIDWKVVEAEGTRLRPGDTFQCVLIVSGEPLYLDNLIHEGSHPGVYVCGRKSGITFKRPNDDGKD